MSTNPMKQVCEALNDGSMSHDDESHIFRQLAVEGRKRIDAFVFEALFRQHLQSIAKMSGGLYLSFGWHIGYNKFGDPAFWFRLFEEENDWNPCDDEMVRRLSEFKCGRFKLAVRCFRVLRVGVSMTASEWKLRKWANPVPLTSLLLSLPNINSGETKEMDSTDKDAAAIAFEWLKKPTLAKTLSSLSVQRRFMNCMLRPCLGRDGTDLDAMALAPNGSLRYIEFKRKYPSVVKEVFGLDQKPHVSTLNTMLKMGIGMQHVILVGPRWEKDESPLLWIQKPLMDSWAWLIANLDPSAFEDEKSDLHTDDIDSGQRKSYREQTRIRWDRIHLLHQGLALGTDGHEKLRIALSSGLMNSLPQIDYMGLRGITVDKQRI